MKKQLDAEIVTFPGTTKEDLQKMKPVKRTTIILQIKRMELLSPEKDGVELNEGYEFEANSAVPELADAIAKMAIEMDSMPDMDKNSGGAFISLIAEYYGRIKGGI